MTDNKKPAPKVEDPKIAELFAEVEKLKAIMRKNGWTL